MRLRMRGPLALGLFAVVLVLGRWIAGFLTNRWWLASVSAEAQAFGARWALLQLLLGLLGTLIAFGWLATNWLAALNGAIRRGQAPDASHRVTLPREHEPLARWGTIAVAGIIAWVFGSEASGWVAQVMLAWEGAPYGVTDPGLGKDIGAYVAELPLWISMHAWVTGATLLTLLGVLAVYLLWGEVRMVKGRLVVHPVARQHLGLLGLVVAAVVVWAQLLMPDKAAAGIPVPVGPSEVSVIEVVALITAGMAAAVGVLTLGWGFRGRHSVLVASWALLGAGYLVGTAIKPTGSSPFSEPGARETRDVLERLAYDLQGFVEGDTIGPAKGGSGGLNQVSLWDPERLPGLVPGDSARFLGGARGLLALGGETRRVWWVLWAAGDTAIHTAPISDESVGDQGGAVAFRPGQSEPGPIESWATQRLDIVRPGAPPVWFTATPDPDAAMRSTGVAAGGIFPRVMLAWALQTGGILSLPPTGRVSWHLRPADRLHAVAPFVDWTTPELRQIDGRLVWLSQGIVTSEAMPMTRRIRWRGRSVGMVRPAFVGVVGLGDGDVTVYHRPGDDPLAAAWAAIAGPLVLETLPQALAIPRDPEWAAAVVHLFGNPPSVREFDAPIIPVSGGGRPGSPSGFFLPNASEWRPADTTLVTMDAGNLEHRWAQLRFFQQLRDSITASGGRMSPGAIRYRLVPNGVIAYRPWYRANREGRVALALVATAAGEEMGIGRSLPDALRALGSDATPEIGAVPRSILDEMRIWMAVADSAFRRGDLTTFARAFEAMRSLLGPP